MPHSMSPLAALVEKKIPIQLHVTHLSPNLFVHKIILLYQRNTLKVYNLKVYLHRSAIHYPNFFTHYTLEEKCMVFQ